MYITLYFYPKLYTFEDLNPHANASQCRIRYSLDFFEILGISEFLTLSNAYPFLIFISVKILNIANI